MLRIKCKQCKISDIFKLVIAAVKKQSLRFKQMHMVVLDLSPVPTALLIRASVEFPSCQLPPLTGKLFPKLLRNKGKCTCRPDQFHKAVQNLGIVYCYNLTVYHSQSHSLHCLWYSLLLARFFVPDLFMHFSFLSYRSHLQCHCIREVFPDHPM